MDKKKYTSREVKKLAREYARYLRDTRHVPVQKAYLFGSYAKKSARAWSDIDVCIVSPVFEHEDNLSFLWRSRRQQDVDAMIAPIGFTPEDFQKNESNPLLHEIKITGIEVGLDEFE